MLVLCKRTVVIYFLFDYLFFFFSTNTAGIIGWYDFEFYSQNKCKSQPLDPSVTSHCGLWIICRLKFDFDPIPVEVTWFQLDYKLSDVTNFTFTILQHYFRWPLMVDIDMWPLISLKSEGSLHASMTRGGHSNGKKRYQARPWTHKKHPNHVLFRYEKRP